MSAEYREGDIIKTNRTLRVARVGKVNTTLVDVQCGDSFTWYPERDNGTLKVEMVKRANDMHTGPKPKAGVILRGRDIKRIWWKRGTIIKLAISAGGWPVGSLGSALVLRADGKWHVLDNDVPHPEDGFTFEQLSDDARFELKYVA